eukprot:scaffold14370_cov19-Prasinocladus_malaysianus.AAC.1
MATGRMPDIVYVIAQGINNAVEKHHCIPSKDTTMLQETCKLHAHLAEIDIRNAQYEFGREH